MAELLSNREYVKCWGCDAYIGVAVVRRNNGDCPLCEAELEEY